jgi:type IV secretory pathway VirD2 relaxase
VGFDEERDAVRVSQTLGQWQRAGDQHLFKVILSPENELHLETFTRRFVTEKVEPDVGRKVQWVAILHRNTGTPHVHLLIRGRDREGQGLRLDGGYVWGGLRQRARELATQMLGWRGREEIEQECERTVTARRWTKLDQSLSRRRAGRYVVVDDTVTPAERARLVELERRGLAWRVDAERWEMSQRWEAEHMTREHYRMQHQDRDTQQHDKEARQELERLREEQERQRRVQNIDQLEQEHELER